MTIAFGPGDGPAIPDYGSFETRCGGNPEASELRLLGAEGEPLWSTPLPYTYDGAIHVADGRVYTTVAADWGELSSAISVGADGSPVWQTSFGWGISRRPLFVDDLMIVFLASEAETGGVVALSMADGTVKWAHPLPGRPLPPVESMTASGLLAAVDYSNNVTTIDTADGSMLWQVTLAHDVNDPAWTLPGHILVPASDRLTALDPSTGVVIWEATRPDQEGWVGRVLGILGSTILAETEDSATLDDSDQYLVSGFDLVSGAHMWDVAASEWAFVAGDVLLAAQGSRGDDEGFARRIAAYDAASGTQLWRSDNRWLLRNSTMHDNELYLAGLGTTLARVEPRSGAVEWSSPFSAMSLSQPAVGRENFAIEVQGDPPHGRVATIDIAAGAVQWTADFDNALASYAFVGGEDIVVLLASPIFACF